MDCRSEKSTINGPIAQAVAQIAETSKLRTLQKAPRQRLSRAITLVDSMLCSLEYLNLEGKAPAPGALASRIRSLRQAMPGECGIRIDPKCTPQRLMDELFNVQQQLLAMRAGPDWEWAYGETEDE
ncbi:hypothetical protein EPN29_11095 [bacterium]|nr:MAG: hypothetical protein EPN29_11095 [bacterium]